MRYLIASDETGAGSSIENCFEASHCSHGDSYVFVKLIITFVNDIYGFGIGFSFDSLLRSLNVSDSLRFDTTIICVRVLRYI